MPAHILVIRRPYWPGLLARSQEREQPDGQAEGCELLSGHTLDGWVLCQAYKL